MPKYLIPVFKPLPRSAFIITACPSWHILPVAEPIYYLLQIFKKQGVWYRLTDCGAISSDKITTHSLTSYKDYFYGYGSWAWQILKNKGYLPTSHAPKDVEFWDLKSSCMLDSKEFALCTHIKAADLAYFIACVENGRALEKWVETDKETWEQHYAKDIDDAYIREQAFYGEPLPVIRAYPEDAPHVYDYPSKAPYSPLFQSESDADVSKCWLAKDRLFNNITPIRITIGS